MFQLKVENQVRKISNFSIFGHQNTETLQPGQKPFRLGPGFLNFPGPGLTKYSDQSHYIFEIKVGKRRIRHGTNLNFNVVIFNRFCVDIEIQFQIRSLSDPILSDNDYKNKIAWVRTTLN